MEISQNFVAFSEYRNFKQVFKTWQFKVQRADLYVSRDQKLAPFVLYWPIRDEYSNFAGARFFNKITTLFIKLECFLRPCKYAAEEGTKNFKKQSYENFKYFCIIIFNDIINNLLFCWFTAHVLKLEIYKRVFSTFYYVPNQAPMSILVVLDLTKLFGVSGHIFCMFQELFTVQYTEYVYAVTWDLIIWCIQIVFGKMSKYFPKYVGSMSNVHT